MVEVFVANGKTFPDTRRETNGIAVEMENQPSELAFRDEKTNELNH
jgi:hypothetical protein